MVVADEVGIKDGVWRRGRWLPFKSLESRRYLNHGGAVVSPEKRFSPGLAREWLFEGGTGAEFNGGTELRVARVRGSQGAGTRLAQRGVCVSLEKTQAPNIPGSGRRTGI